ncbi:hypothetical protein [Mycolicibacterium aubagnense]|uniref:Uncharacterized protein n=1 Tax=Mycolicibacterium aubagnense TaxID=319707 RepID=A0ABN5YKJ7_9MYCO|nr:hypothetical protein [Mycolicibacterium aubagnense]TLH64446.1 hypothetical protein C1S80_12235 [Mycolicibacterium aubagnense]BBX82180.1 hypothetical protein MAUB_00530 [Mycolicibacterium aubagnense]
MARYEEQWSDVPVEQYNSFPLQVQSEIRAKLELILDDPHGNGSYDKDTDQWTAVFGSRGTGLIVYVVSDVFVRVTFLRFVLL